MTSLETAVQTQSELTTDVTRLTGRVKWFNTKAGYGFITVCEGDHNGKDIFVHYTSIHVDNSQYKYLVQGEYVDFSLIKPENSDHEYHAVEVSGIKGGNLMCETRQLNTRNYINTSRVKEEPVIETRTYRVIHDRDNVRPVQRYDDRYSERPVERVVRVRDIPPRREYVHEDEFVRVVRKRPVNDRRRP